MSEINPLIENGHLHFGENKVQEAVDKWTVIKKSHESLKLHMIGKLQTNKVKYVIPLFDYIHSLDNIRLAEKIATVQLKENRSLKIFIQVNIGKEPQKAGLDINDLKNFYKKCTQELKLNIIDIKSPIPHSQQLDSNGFFHYASNPDHCCYLNKVMPLDSLLKENNVWMTGVRKDQTLNRATMEMEEPCKFGSIVFRPMLEWTSKDIYDYIREYDLPKHPLEKSGYVSIGCVPCTTIGIGMDNRESRWQGQNKTECGLHN